MASSTTRIENIKDFDVALKSIAFIEALNNTSVELVNNGKTQAVLTKNKKDFALHLDDRDLVFDEVDEIKQLPVKINKTDFLILNCQFTSSGTRIDFGKSVALSCSYSVHTIQSTDFKSTSAFRAFFPVELKQIRTFHNEFETVTYQDDKTDYFYDCIRVVVDNKQFDITQIKVEEKGYYVIESFSEMTFEEFGDYCFYIRIGIGFVNGFVVGGEEYVFSNNNGLYYSNYIRPSIKAMYNPIITNPYSRPDIEQSVADYYFDKLTRISSSTLSKLITVIKADLSSVIILLLEVTSIRSLLAIPSIFAVVIEALAKIIAEQEVGVVYPISDPALKSIIMNELTAVIDNNLSSIEPSSAIKLKRRIQAINNPINRSHLTNDEKLTQPFEQLGLSLTMNDINIIKHRNDLLHGNILMRSDNETVERDTNAYMAYVSAKLYTLISKLILKYVGYTGYVYNQSKYLEKHAGVETTEDYFERI